MNNRPTYYDSSKVSYDISQESARILFKSFPCIASEVRGYHPGGDKFLLSKRARRLLCKLVARVLQNRQDRIRSVYEKGLD